MNNRLNKKFAIVFDRVSYRYPTQKTDLFQDLSFEVKFGEAVSFLCPDGQGRTTLLKLMMGLENPTQGRVYLNEFPLNRLPIAVLNDYRAQIGFVFSSGALINNLSIFDNVALPLRYHGGLDETRVKTHVQNTLARFHILEFQNNRPAFVSQFVKKTAGIARAFIMTPPMFLIDNLFSGLTRKQVVELTLHLKEATALSEGTFIYTFNDPEISQHFTDRVILLRNGKLFFDGSNTEFLKSSKPEIQKYLADTMVSAA